MTCKACTEVQESKRAAIVAVPMTKPNPRWLKRFQDKARDLLLQRDFLGGGIAESDPWADGECGIGEFWGRAETYRTDEEIVEEACKHADWMRFKRSALVIGEPTPVVNAFAGMVHQSQRYEDVAAAVKVERTIPDPEGEKRVAYLRAQMPDKCQDHLELDKLRAENAKLKGLGAASAVKEYVKLSVQNAKLTGQELTGKVRIVSFEPSGKVPLQGEVHKPSLKPYSIPESMAPKQDWRTAADEARMLAEMRREERLDAEAKFKATVLKAKGSDNVGDVDAAYAKLGTHRALCRCLECAHERSIRAKGTVSQWSV